MRQLKVLSHALQASSFGELLQPMRKRELKTVPADMSGNTATILGKALIQSLVNVCAVNNLARTISLGISTVASVNATTTKFVKAKRTTVN